MKKGSIVSEQVIYFLIAVIVVSIVATVVSTPFGKIFFLVKTGFSSEQRCEKTDKPLSEYKEEFISLQLSLEKSESNSPEYTSLQERIVVLYEEYQTCSFSEQPNITPRMHEAIARYYAAKGNKEKAITAYEKLLQEKPHTKEAERALAELRKKAK